MVVVDAEGSAPSSPSRREPAAHCVFEHVYFARPDSLVFGRNVLESRLRLGRQLARESPADADVVCPVPDSGMGAALGYARESGLPFEWGLIRNHYVGRTFIEPRPVRALLRGQDQAEPGAAGHRGPARGADRRLDRARHHLAQDRAAWCARPGRARCTCASRSPPTTGPCYYGIDTPLKSELIASSHSVEEIRRFIEADSLAYLSHEGLLEAVGRRGRAPALHGLLLGPLPGGGDACPTSRSCGSSRRRGPEPRGRHAAPPRPRPRHARPAPGRRRPRAARSPTARSPRGSSGWDVAILTTAGPDFEPERELPGIPVFLRRSSATTRFVNEYDEDGTRRQVVTARADDVDLAPLPDAWRDPDVLLLGPVVGELAGVGAAALAAGCVGAIAQGWLRAIDAAGQVSAREWARPERDLARRPRPLPLRARPVRAPTPALGSCSPTSRWSRSRAAGAGLTLLTAAGEPRGALAPAAGGGPDRRRRRLRRRVPRPLPGDGRSARGGGLRAPARRPARSRASGPRPSATATRSCAAWPCGNG